MPRRSAGSSSFTVVTASPSTPCERASATWSVAGALSQRPGYLPSRIILLSGISRAQLCRTIW
jgi:hypothetical protein